MHLARVHEASRTRIENTHDACLRPISLGAQPTTMAAKHYENQIKSQLLLEATNAKQLRPQAKQDCQIKRHLKELSKG